MQTSLACSSRAHATLAVQHCQHRRAPSAVQCSNGTLFEPEHPHKSIPDGSRVKVCKPVKVYHVPKVPELELEGLQGEVQKNCALYKGKVLSPNLPYMVKFQTQVGESQVKFTAHLAEDELQVV